MLVPLRVRRDHHDLRRDRHRHDRHRHDRHRRHDHHVPLLRDVQIPFFC